jgi:hypothetical protein
MANVATKAGLNKDVSWMKYSDLSEEEIRREIRLIEDMLKPMWNTGDIEAVPLAGKLLKLEIELACR